MTREYLKHDGICWQCYYPSTTESPNPATLFRLNVVNGKLNCQIHGTAGWRAPSKEETELVLLHLSRSWTDVHVADVVREWYAEQRW